MKRALALCSLGLALAGCEARSTLGPAGGHALDRVAELSRKVTEELRCPDDTWPIYAHDARRSSASKGCCKAPLIPAWRWEPASVGPRKSRLFHAVVSHDAVYASGIIGESPAVFALGLDAKHRWTFDSHVDITRHVWPAFVLDRVILNDDGLYILDPLNGEKEVDRGLDAWGDVITDGKNLFAVNTWYIAGPKTYVGALEVGGAPLWKHHEYGQVREDVLDRLGGIALSGDRLFFAPNYTPSPGAGLYAYSTAGKPLWSVATLPKSHVAIEGQTLYAFERHEGGSGDLLVARDSSSGAIRWSINAASPESSAPLVSQGLVLYRERGGDLVAVRRTDGTEAWRSALSPPAQSDVAWATSLAAAEGSGTIVAVDGKQLVVISVSAGTLEWRGAPASAATLHSPVIAGGRVYVVDGNALSVLRCAPS